VRRATGVAAAALAVLGCGAAPSVERAYDGRVIDGRFVPAEAYAAFLQGAVVEAQGDVAGALAAYETAARLDPAGPEAWTRVGAVRCTASATDRHADEAFARALAADPTYARAWEAEARCSLSRGRASEAAAQARRAAELDPSADGANVLLVRAGLSTDPATRGALVALTMTARDPLVAWDALAAWAQGHADVALYARAQAEAVAFEPARRAAAERAAEELAGSGEIGAGRVLAAAAADAGEGPLPAGPRSLAARLAVDEAIARRDPGRVRRRATRARIGLEEAAGRALLEGADEVARDLAREVGASDAEATGASLVLATSAGRDVVGAAILAGKERGIPASGASWVALGAALVRLVDPSEARSMLAAIPHGEILPGDDPVVRSAVRLVAIGAVAPDVLPPDGIVELAVLRSPSTSRPRATEALDARHRYLALALDDPGSRAARELAVRFSGVAARDPVAAAASALVALAAGGPIDPSTPRWLLERDPTDPLLAAAALRLAERIGDADAAGRARASLQAIAAGSWF